MAKDGELRVSPATDYDRDGFVVEEFGVVSWSGADGWYVPGWVEDCWGRSGFFPTEQDARDFLEMVAA